MRVVICLCSIVRQCLLPGGVIQQLIVLSVVGTILYCSHNFSTTFCMVLSVFIFVDICSLLHSCVFAQYLVCREWPEQSVYFVDNRFDKCITDIVCDKLALLVYKQL